MESDVHFGEGDGPADVEITISGVPTAQAFLELNARLAPDPRFVPGLTMLVDCSGLDVSGLADDDLQILSAPMVERDWSYPPSAVALVASDERILAALRAYRAHLGGSKSNRHLFRSRAEAVEWLQARRSG